MEISKNYVPGEIEKKWYDHWIKKGYFILEEEQEQI